MVEEASKVSSPSSFVCVYMREVSVSPLYIASVSLSRMVYSVPSSLFSCFAARFAVPSRKRDAGKKQPSSALFVQIAVTRGFYCSTAKKEEEKKNKGGQRRAAEASRSTSLSLRNSFGSSVSACSPP